MARILTLLQGNLLDSDQGGIAFCAVNLVEGLDAAGRLRRIVVDTGSSGRWRALLAALERHGLQGSDIDAVLLTHAHWDHIQNLDPFSSAVFYLHPAELDYLDHPHPGDFATPSWTKAVLDRYDVREIRGDDLLLPGVRVLEAPGHSAGSVALSVATDDGTAVIAGDAIQNAAVARHGRNSLVFWDEESANRSVVRLRELADVIYPGHDRAFRISGSGQVGYTQELELTITGSTAEIDGLALTRSDDFDPLLCPYPRS